MVEEVIDGRTELSLEELETLRGGEVLTIALVLTYTAVAVITVIVWKIYQSKKGKATFPGGFSFEWGTIISPLLDFMK